MGCSASNQDQAELEHRVKQQAAQISNLQKVNEELKQSLERILAENSKTKAKEIEEKGVHKKIEELEAKVIAMEAEVAKKQESDDTLNRGSESESPPLILLGSQTLEKLSQKNSLEEPRPSCAILDDPAIKEKYDRKREMFLRKMSRPAEAATGSPTLASTSMSNKHP